MIFGISFTVLIVYMLYLSREVLIKDMNQLSFRQITKRLSVLLTILVAFSLSFRPEDFIRWDLIEHYKMMDLLNGLDFNEYFHYNEITRSYWGFTLLLYLINLFSTKEILPVIPILVDFCVFAYIFRDMLFKKNEETLAKYQFSVIVLIWLTMFGLKLSISGIRSSMAYTISFLSLYLYYKDKKNILLSLLFLLISFSFHSCAIATIPLFLACKTKKSLIISISVFSSIYSIISVFTFFDNSYSFINTSIKKFQRFSSGYSLEHLLASGIMFLVNYIAMILLIIVLLATYLTIADKRIIKNPFFAKIHYGYLFAMIFGLVISTNYLFLERYFYFLAYFSTSSYLLHINNFKPNGLFLFVFVALCLYISFYNDLFIFFVNMFGDFYTQSLIGILHKIFLS